MLDLLTLIGNSIEKLQRSVELLEASRRADGLKQLSSVILEIDSYIKQIDDDPLLKLAPIDRASLGERLQSVKGEIMSVIDGLPPTTP